MKYLYHILVIIVLSVCSNNIAQQTPLFSDYYYNPVLINPAHTGYYSNTEINLSNFGYLNQFEGNPRTFSGIFNTNILKNKVGIGGGFISDKIGVMSATTVFASYAYKLYFDRHYNRARWWDYNPSVLSFGLTTGVMLIHEKLSELAIQGDPNFQKDIDITLPTFGIGMLYSQNNFYLGFSIQNLFSNTAANDQNINVTIPYYFYGGYRWYFNRFEELRFQPSFLAKYVSGAPLQFDLNFSVNYKNKIEMGAGYRTNSSINALVGFYVFDTWRFAYNYTMYENNTPFNNTNGFILTYRFGKGF